VIAFLDASALIYLIEGTESLGNRVRHSLRTPDTLQAASCLQLGARHVFLTGDAGFRKVEGLNVRLLA